jgi:hypothetical protein
MVRGGLSCVVGRAVGGCSCDDCNFIVPLLTVF